MYSNGKGIIDLASKMTLIQSRILRENIELVSTSNAFDKRRLLSLGNICLSSPKSFRDSAFIINYVITSIQESSNTEDYENFIVRLVMERRDIFTSLEESRQRAIFSKFPSILEYYVRHDLLLYALYCMICVDSFDNGVKVVRNYLSSLPHPTFIY